MTKRLGRPESSVVNKLKRLGTSRRVRDGYTIRELELCLGKDHHKITKWIRSGWLQDRLQGRTHFRPPRQTEHSVFCLQSRSWPRQTDGLKPGACTECVPRCEAPSRAGPTVAGPCREPVLFCQTKTLGSRPRSLPAHADASSPAARIEFQSVSVETSPFFPEDVNRARWFLDADLVIDVRGGNTITKQLPGPL